MGVTSQPLAIGIRIKETVGAMSTLTIDSNASNSFKGARYFMTAWGNSLVKNLSFDVINNNGNVCDAIFSRLETGLSLSVSIEEAGSDIIFQVTNNESFSVDVELIKFLTGQ